MSEVKKCTSGEFGYNLSWFVIWAFIGIILGRMQISLSLNSYYVDSTSLWVRFIQLAIALACGWRSGDYVRSAWFLRPWKKRTLY